MPRISRPQIEAEVAALRGKASELGRIGARYLEASHALEVAARNLAGEAPPTVLQMLAETTGLLEQARLKREERARTNAAAIIADARPGKAA